MKWYKKLYLGESIKGENWNGLSFALGKIKGILREIF